MNHNLNLVVLVGVLIGLIGAGCLYAREEPVAVLASEKLPAVAAHGLVVLDDGAVVLVADSYRKEGKRQVWKVELVTDEVTGEISVGAVSVFGKLSYKQPGGMAVSGDGKTVYVCDTAAARIYVQDAKDGRLTGAIESAGMPWNVIWVEGVKKESGEKKSANLLWYVTTDGRLHRHDLKSGRTTLVIDSETRKPVVVEHAFDLVLHPVTGEIVVTQQEPGRVLAIDGVTGVVRVLAEGFANPEGIACLVDEAGEVVFVVADTEAGAVYVLRDLEANDESGLMAKELLSDGLVLPICARALNRPGAVVVTARQQQEGHGVLVILNVDAGAAGDTDSQR